MDGLVFGAFVLEMKRNRGPEPSWKLGMQERQEAPRRWAQLESQDA